MLQSSNWFWCSSEVTLTCVWQPAHIWLDTRVYNTPLKTTRWTNIPRYADNFECLQGGALVTLLSPLWIIFGGWMGPRWVPGAGKEGRQDSFLGITGEHMAITFFWPSDDDCEHFIFLNTKCFSSFKFNSIVIWCSICFTEVLFQFASTFQLVVLDFCFAQHPSYSSTNEYLLFCWFWANIQFTSCTMRHHNMCGMQSAALLSSDHPSFLTF